MHRRPRLARNLPVSFSPTHRRSTWASLLLIDAHRTQSSVVVGTNLVTVGVGKETAGWQIGTSIEAGNFERFGFPRTVADRRCARGG